MAALGRRERGTVQVSNAGGMAAASWVLSGTAVPPTACHLPQVSGSVGHSLLGLCGAGSGSCSSLAQRGACRQQRRGSSTRTCSQPVCRPCTRQLTAIQWTRVVPATDTSSRKGTCGSHAAHRLPGLLRRRVGGRRGGFRRGLHSRAGRRAEAGAQGRGSKVTSACSALQSIIQPEEEGSAAAHCLSSSASAALPKPPLSQRPGPPRTPRSRRRQPGPGCLAGCRGRAGGGASAGPERAARRGGRRRWVLLASRRAAEQGAASCMPHSSSSRA